MGPTENVRAEEAVALSEYTEEQLLTAFLGNWEGDLGASVVIKKDHVTIEKKPTWIDAGLNLDTDWTYEGMVELEGRRLTYADFEKSLNGETLNTKTKALKFTSEEYSFFVYISYVDTKYLTVEYVQGATGNSGIAHVFYKEASNGSELFISAALEEAVKNTPVVEKTVEKSNTEETVETPIENSTPELKETEDKKEVIEKTKDGRNVYSGETVYVVKSGDCLWNIAEQLLGDGARYKELFTRNGEIIETARLIFPGQEIIVTSK